MFMITSFLTTLCLIWMAARIYKSSPGLAVVSFFIFPVAIIPLIQNWGDEEGDIKVPFFLALAGSMYTVYSLMSFARRAAEDQESFLMVARMLA